MTITRRRLAGLLAGTPVVLRQSAGAPPPQTSRGAADSPGQLSQAGAASLRKSTATIRKLDIPAATEPAFSFRAQ
jgi:hypothetical protein